MQSNNNSPKGIVIYGTGNVGMNIARLIKQRGWTIRCAANRTGKKIGCNLSELSGFPELGGILVSDAATLDFSTLDADVAIVAVSDRLEYNESHHKQLLKSGLNVICLGTESSFPWAANNNLAREYDQIAKTNGVTFTGGGFWDTYRIWSVKSLVGPSTALREIRHQSVTNADRFGEEVIRLAGIGEECTATNDSGDNENTEGSSIYRVLVPQVVSSIGLTVKNVVERKEPVILDQAAHCSTLNKTIEPGLCVGTRSVIEVTTQEGVSAVAEIDLRLTKEGEDEWIGWTVDGDPPAQMTLQGLDSGHATASSVVNRIPDVIAAPPGVISVDQMPPMQPFIGQVS